MNNITFTMTSTIDDNICRLCAHPGQDYQFIFSDNANSILDKIHNCLPLVVDENDQLPRHICSPCLEALNISDKLRIQSIEADALLRKQLNVLSNGVKEEPKDPLMTEPDEFTSNSDEIKAYKEVINLGPAPSQVCEHCNEEFKTDKDLREHDCTGRCNDNVDDEENINSETLNPLNVVEQIFPHSGAESMVNCGQNKSRCDICNVTIKNKQFMKFHKKFHEPRPMFCSYCSNTFPSPYDLSIHKKLIHKRWPTCFMKWFCERCETLTSSEKCLKKHMAQCNKKIYPCTYCNENFAYRLVLITHQKQNHYNLMLDDPNCVKFNCDTCDKTFVDKTAFTHHSRRHQAIKTGLWKCPYCDKSFATRINMKNHIQAAHERNEVFKCDICDKVFYNGKNMRRHRRRHDKLTCPECNAHFDSVSILDNHLYSEHNISQGRDRFPCKLCNLIFSKKRLLRDHQNVHTGKRPYSCDICNKTFRNYDAHWSHMQKHKEISYCCDYCNKKFKLKISLRKHIPSHQAPEEWQYYCEICEVNFRNHEILKRHMEKNEDLHRRTCDICDFEVLGTHNLRKHKSQVHDIWEAMGVNNSKGK